MSTRYFIDTEFVDDGKTIDLISLGIVSNPDGRELYVQSSEFNIDKASPWVRENVLMRLPLCPHIFIPDRSLYSLGTVYGQQSQHRQGQCTFSEPAKGIIGAHTDCFWRIREQMKREVRAFMDPEKYGRPELWAWCGGYDWVALCQLFGTMMDIPAGWPHYIRDFQQVLDERDISDDELPEQEEDVHNALADAAHLKRLWGYIIRNDAWQ